jgi:molybdate transport system substrate-binding protein
MKKTRYFIFLAVFLAFISSACGAPNTKTESRRLTVYAAASLTEAMTEMGKEFEDSHPGVTVVFNFGGSQNLRTQIEQGAPADIFASANAQEMEMLVAQNRIAADAPKVFLTNQLIVILPTENPAGIASLQDLSRQGLKLVLAAEEVPAGKYAREVLKNLNALYGADYSDKVLANIVSNEDNIRQAVTKVQLGEVDASIVYVSDATAAPDLQTIEIAPEMNVTAEYLMAPLSGSANSDLANEFIDYVLSGEGGSILQKWGFTPVVP